MRHRKSFNHLGRTSSHRKAMLSNMATSLILHKRINTTVAKAKALRTYVEPLITKAKDDTTHSRRVVFSYLQDKYAVTELFREISAKVGDRPGGYTRIIKLGNRLGDNAEMAMIELVDYNENLVTEKSTKKKSTRRRRGGAKKQATDQGTPVAAADVVEDVVVEEEVKTEAEAEVKEEPVEAKTDEKPPEAIKEEVAEEAKVSEDVVGKNESVKSEKPKAEVKEEAKEEEEVKAETKKPKAKKEDTKKDKEEKTDEGKEKEEK